MTLASSQDVKESDFLDTVTQTRQVVCHFWHRDFLRCKIVDKHLGQLAKQHFDTRFIKVSAAVRAFDLHISPQGVPSYACHH